MAAAYVVHYDNLDGPCQVVFSETPDMVFDRWGVDWHRDCLRGLGIQVGEHNCDFRTEELGSGKFAIVCPTHPKRAA